MVWSRSSLILCLILFTILLPCLAFSQSLLDAFPSNPLNLPKPSVTNVDGVFLSGSMFPGLIRSNFEVRYLHTFGDIVESNWLTLDYLLPVKFGDNVLFGQAHSEFQDFLKTIQGGVGNRVDVSIGGGFRKMLLESTMVGVNAFYDSARLSGRWQDSFGLGAEMISITSGHDTAELIFNWYEKPHNNIFSTIARSGKGNYDLEAGYSHERYNDGPDLSKAMRNMRSYILSPKRSSGVFNNCRELSYFVVGVDHERCGVNKISYPIKIYPPR